MKKHLFLHLGIVGLMGLSTIVYGGSTPSYTKYVTGDGKIPNGDCLEMMCQYGCVEDENGLNGTCCPNDGTNGSACTIGACCQSGSCNNGKCDCPADKPIWNGAQCCFDVGCGCNVAKVNGCCPGVVDLGCGCGVPANYTGAPGAYCTINACCDPQHYCVANKCVRICPIDQTWDPVNQKCVCPTEKPVWNGQNCVTCPSDKPIWDGHKCVECLYHRAGYYPVNQRCNDVYKPFCVDGQCTCDCETNLPDGMTCKCESGARFYRTSKDFTYNRVNATIKLPAQTFIHQANNVRVNGAVLNSARTYGNICYTDTPYEVSIRGSGGAYYEGWVRVRTEITEGANPSQEQSEKYDHARCQDVK